VKSLSIAGINLRRMFRDRTNLFFMFVLPLMLVLILGAAFGNAGTPVLGVLHAGALLEPLRAEPAMRVQEFGDETTLRSAVERGEVSAGLAVPSSGSPRFLARPDRGSQQLRLVVGGVLVREANRRAASEFVAEQSGLDTAGALSIMDAVRVEPVTVTTTSTGKTQAAPDSGQFDSGAATQLVLFVFLTALTSSVALVETRRLGVTRRMLATPTSTRTVVLGEALGRIGVALMQGLIILTGSALLFGVRWGDPVAAVALLSAFALVAGGTGMLLGSVARTEQQTVGAGLLLGMGLAALGGCMVPLEFFGDTMRKIAYFTPHAWANEGFAILAHHGGDLVSVAPQLAVLLGTAIVLFGLGAWRLGRSVTS
jgi:ABC-2 type transport system permease protein